MAKIPNRSEDLARPRERKGTTGYKVTKGEGRTATIPEPKPTWCDAARMIWDANCDSGGSDFYESSDYAVLWFACDQIDHLYSQGGRRSPEYLRVIMQTLGSLLATEGDRRRLHIELEKEMDEGDAAVLSIVKNAEAELDELMSK